MKTKQVVVLALMVSQALILSIVETWIPMPVPVPGVKIGLANVITLVVIVFFGYREAILVVLIRCLLSSLFGGGIIVFLFSISGGILSTTIMALMYKKMSKSLSIVGVSIAGAVMHNIGQLMVAILVIQELLIFTYLPVLLVSGVIMGTVTGICGNFLIKALARTKIFE